MQNYLSINKIYINIKTKIIVQNLPFKIPDGILPNESIT